MRRPLLLLTMTFLIALLAVVPNALHSGKNVEKVSTQPSCPGQDQFRDGNPEADARAAVAKGDHHLLGIYALYPVVPGLEVAPGKYYHNPPNEPGGDFQATFGLDQSTLPVVMMKRSGENAQSPGCFALGPIFESYAKRYNETILSTLE